MFKPLNFHTFPGIRSPHVQMFLANFGPTGLEPVSRPELIRMSDGDLLSCEISTPLQWLPEDPTVVMVHGLGGSHLSGYMIRQSRKFYHNGMRVVRVNLRGCGSGKGLNKLPYNSGTSHDIYDVLKTLKAKSPHSPITLVGFSLGGNVILKMAGEHGLEIQKLVRKLIAVCPPLDIEHCVTRISRRRNWAYHKYFLNSILDQGWKWIQEHSIRSIQEYDDKITAPLWGYANAKDYYDKCSSSKFIGNIQVPGDLIFAADDPFIDHNILSRVQLPSHLNAWLSPIGGHMGFIGWGGKGHGVFCLDKIVEELLMH